MITIVIKTAMIMIIDLQRFNSEILTTKDYVGDDEDKEGNCDDDKNDNHDDDDKDDNHDDEDETCKVSTVTILTTLRKADMLIAFGTGGDGLKIIIIIMMLPMINL